MATIATASEVKTFSWADCNPAELKVGDEISDVLKNGEKVIFIVIDDGVIGLKNCLVKQHCMNPTATNEGGWAKSDMRRYLNEEVFSLLPDDLQSVIKPRSLSETQDKLWLFSEAEVFGEQSWTEQESDHGTQFAYFKEPANRIKCDADGNSIWWWVRSPSTTYSALFCSVYSNVGANVNYADGSYGVCFGFLI